MKRGVVVKQSRRSTIVLTSEGTFLEISAKGKTEIGQEVEFTAEEMIRRTHISQWTPSVKNLMRVAVLVLVFVLALFPMYSWYVGNKAYAYVSLDFNPSIELKVNNRMDVVSITGLNQEARTVIDNLDDWQGEAVEEVAANILRKSSDLGLLADSESIIIGVNYIDTRQDDKKLTNILEGSVNEFNNSLHIASFQVPDKVREVARNKQKSMNEIMAQSILEGTYLSTSVPPLTQSDSAIIKDFYKDNVEVDGKEQDETSRRPIDSVNQKSAYVVKEETEKKEANTISKQNNTADETVQQSAKKEKERAPVSNQKTDQDQDRITVSNQKEVKRNVKAVPQASKSNGNSKVESKQQRQIPPNRDTAKQQKEKDTREHHSQGHAHASENSKEKVARAQEQGHKYGHDKQKEKKHGSSDTHKNDKENRGWHGKGHHSDTND
ncbi:anti-sigma factor domain-containing protein [Terribacillus sp. DMT04]|uniref:anti-sigma factor domain-containing protein n=1 Tax=Terribacillus sp. DMT04 TaxID=2850441 RepID=UPI001C2B8843|nr:anti-sigma factor domain-containing protein [Terribacillus sp. DMT04]QXE02624.1 anti-sigma factor domain-containing protein [Terribacillus sp. DMT04]